MAAGTANAAEFKDYPLVAPDGEGLLYGEFTIPTTGEDTAADRINLMTLPEGLFIVAIKVYANDALDAHATPTLDADLVLVTGVDAPSDAGTETVLYNAGTRWQAASTTIVETLVASKIAEAGYNGKAYLRWKVVTGVATAAAGVIKVGLILGRKVSA